MALSKATLTLVVVAALASQSTAHPEFRERIPNALNVKGVDALGHVDPAGGGPRNKFGLAFAANGLKWSVELCKADSDGDGQTNGQELGDPCCQWTQTGTAKVLWTTGVSAPGDATSKSDPTLWATVKCDGASNSTSGSAAANATTPASSSAAPSTSSKAPTATTAAPKSAAVSVSTGAAALALAAATTVAALL